MAKYIIGKEQPEIFDFDGDADSYHFRQGVAYKVYGLDEGGVECDPNPPIRRPSGNYRRTNGDKVRQMIAQLVPQITALCLHVKAGGDDSWGNLEIETRHGRYIIHLIGFGDACVYRTGRKMRMAQADLRLKDIVDPIKEVAGLMAYHVESLWTEVELTTKEASKGSFWVPITLDAAIGELESRAVKIEG